MFQDNFNFGILFTNANLLNKEYERLQTTVPVPVPDVHGYQWPLYIVRDTF